MKHGAVGDLRPLLACDALRCEHRSPVNVRFRGLGVIVAAYRAHVRRGSSERPEGPVQAGSPEPRPVGPQEIEGEGSVNDSIVYGVEVVERHVRDPRLNGWRCLITP